MGEILTDAGLLREGLRERRRDHRRGRIVGEILADAAHEFDRGVEHGTPVGEAFPRIIRRRGEARHIAAGVQILRGRASAERLAVESLFTNEFPGAGRGGIGRLRAVDLDDGGRHDGEFAVRRLDHHRSDAIAEEAGALLHLLWRRVDLQLGFKHALARPVLRQQAQGAIIERHRRTVFVDGDVLYVVDHARPLAVSARATCGPCRK